MQSGKMMWRVASICEDNKIWMNEKRKKKREKHLIWAFLMDAGHIFAWATAKPFTCLKMGGHAGPRPSCHSPPVPDVHEGAFRTPLHAYSDCVVVLMDKPTHIHCTTAGSEAMLCPVSLEISHPHLHSSQAHM